jgi:hypothetical protein
MKRLLASLIAVVSLVACADVTVSEEPLASTAPSSTQPSPPTNQVEGAVDASASTTPRRPRHLRLWHIDAPVVELELTGTELVPPADPEVLGWWGRPAGAKHGTTLLTGHTVHTGGGELDDLEDIPVGTVGSLSGVRYVVQAVLVIPKSALARRAPSLFCQDGPHRLVLVTCEDYDPATGEYASNVVVTMKPATS